MAHLFSPFALKGRTLRNRIVMPPMVMDMAGPDGRATAWHLVHYGARALGGTGLLILEATGVEYGGRITERSLGLWEDGQIGPLTGLVRFCQEQGALVGIQLVHAGRKSWSPTRGFGPAPLVGPSAVAYDEGWAVPEALDPAGIQGIITAFRRAAERASAAGFDAVELHGAHGYLLHQFLSPIANHRDDAYGSSLKGRARLLLEVTEAVRAVWPEDRLLLVRLSVTDWLTGGLTVEEQVQVAAWLKDRGVDIIDCSAGGIGPAGPSYTGPGYMVPLAERVRREAAVPTIAVGLITTPELAEEVVANGRADLVALGRELLRHPQWPLHAAQVLKQEVPWPEPYLRARPG